MFVEVIRWSGFLQIVMIVFNCNLSVSAPYRESSNSNIPMKVIWGVPAKDVELPCDVTPPLPSDSVTMVFWYKDEGTMAMYSLDARGIPLEKASHLAASQDVGARSYFIADHPSRARLKIQNVTLEDEGVFRCRVDFLNSPTRNFKVNLTLVELSSTPKIFSAEGKLIKTEAGPFLEGQELFLSCQVEGGRPRPSLTWWFNGSVLDNVVDTKKGAYTTVNQLVISRLPREYKGGKLECRASSMDIADVIIREVPLIIYLRPNKVKIVTPNDLMSSAKTHTSKCETSGSYPPAKLTWILNGRTIKSSVLTEEENEAFSSSIVSLSVEAEDDGTELVCRADNPRFPGGSLEDRRQIHVAYSPKVAVKMHGDVTSTIKEGSSIDLLCSTKSKPAAHNYNWYYNGHLVRYNLTAGFLPVDDKLTLRNIKKAAAGEYSCSATNTEGETYSPPFHLGVQYAPRCKVGFEEMRVGIMHDEEIIVHCHVDATPEDVRFSWTYNTSRGVFPVQAANIQNKGTMSTLHFTTRNVDIESLSCWASNIVGRQEVPCLFHVVPANRPESPRNCVLNNSTAGSVEIVCSAGADGGLAQSFVLEVSDLTGVQNAESISTLSDQAEYVTPLFRVLGEEPIFKLHSLQPGRSYQAVVYAQNAKGRSKPPVILSNVRVDNVLEIINSGIDRDNLNSNGMEEGFPVKQNITLLLITLVASIFLLIICIVCTASMLACKKNNNVAQTVVMRRPRRCSKPNEDLELSEAGFGEGFHRRSAQYRASMYAQEIDQDSSGQRQTGPDLILTPSCLHQRGNEY
nr:nephrin isoform X2 [Onthophagus taurus]